MADGLGGGDLGDAVDLGEFGAGRQSLTGGEFAGFDVGSEVVRDLGPDVDRQISVDPVRAALPAHGPTLCRERKLRLMR